MITEYPTTLIADPMIPVPYRVMRTQMETSDTFTMNLQPASGPHLATFKPGQFNMLYVFGVGEVPISISGDPAAPETIVHTTRAVGTVTRVMKDLQAGQMIGLRGPFGTHWPVEQMKNRNILIITGGIGLAPLRPAIYHLLAHAGDYGQVTLLYGARTPNDMLYVDQLRQWQSGMTVHVTVDRGNPQWRGNVGVVTTLLNRCELNPATTRILVCGPEIMMHYAILELHRLGMKNQDIYVSMERNMKCAVGFCGHCQYGPHFICKDGPVFRFDKVSWLFGKKEI